MFRDSLLKISQLLLIFQMLRKTDQCRTLEFLVWIIALHAGQNLWLAESGAIFFSIMRTLSITNDYLILIGWACVVWFSCYWFLSHRKPGFGNSAYLQHNILPLSRVNFESRREIHPWFPRAYNISYTFQIHFFNFEISWPSFVIPNPNGKVGHFLKFRSWFVLFSFCALRIQLFYWTDHVETYFRLSSYSALRQPR